MVSVSFYSYPWVGTRDINGATMTTAVCLAKVFADHAEFAFDFMGADRSLEHARKVCHWVERNRKGVFRKRDCFTALQGTFKKVANIEEPLNTLVERNYLRAETMKTAGRPSINYIVNPEIISGWM